ncbi:MAG TPA: mechanosensitive ion channel family protein [Phenylobacterium sp.]|nr:mechanosensitive ion channel family protein [Phenylobacterium sp.]
METLGDAVAGAQQRLTWLPDWALSLLILAAFAGLAVALHGVAVSLVRRALKRRDEFWRTLIQRTRGPSRLALLVVGLGLAANLAPLTEGQASLLKQVLLVAFIVLIGWIALTALDIASAIYLRRFKIDVADNLLARKHVTQTRILRRAAAVLIVVLTTGFALMTIPGVRQYGVSLLASAGVAGIILGLALQPVLTNLLAGIQIAITQPIRLDDAVIVEGEWGNVEEIGATYVVVKLWDWRRMVLPLSYFITTPFQNWTRENASLIGAAMIYVDYSAPVDEMRAKLEEIAKASPLWDGDVVNLAVTELSERTMQIRCLISASSAGKVFDLRTHVREEMVEWLKVEYPGALPRDRLDLPREFAPTGEARAH